MNKLTHVVALLVLLLAMVEVNADIISYWNFNSYDGDANNIAADTGAGVIDIDGTWTATDLNNFSGSTINTLGGDPAGSSLSLVGQGNNGNGFDIAIDTTSFENLELSFATRRSTTGFDSNTVLYSSDGGTNFLQLGGAFVPGGSFGLETFDFSAISSLNNNADVVLRIVLNGATTGSGNNRFDNIQINGDTITSVPEPTSAVLLGVLGIGVLVRRRK